MANYSARRLEVSGSFESDSNVIELRDEFNPFPGLRPFTFDESHLFFGREGQIDEILFKLSQNNSIAVLGSSGSGKSSLVYSGLIPALYGGFVTETGPNWAVVQSRPGLSPIDNLANSIVDSLLANNHLTIGDKEIQKAILVSVLRSSSFGLIEVAKFLQRKSDENVCFLIDQFEEIFRFSKMRGEESKNEASHYINLLLTALSQRETPVYAVISMRSDFINDCAEFQGLTEIINQSNYVVPKMTREQKRMAIEGPVSVGGGRISGRLTKRLLADLENVSDALPILQHALMRTWDYWAENREEGEPMDIRHYNAIGRIEQALSQHANEAFDELSPRDKELAEAIFKNITEKNQDNQGLRRPGKISEISELANATESEIISVVDQFRKPGRSFLMPGIQVKLRGESVIEISHESMMRIWTRLSGWVDDEYESSQMYKRLAEASAMYQIGRTGLWRPPDLQLALNWQKKQNPTRTWAQRYDIAFERAIVFLDTSRITYEAELKNQEMLQKRMLRRARITNIILSLAFLVAMVFFFFGLTQRIDAEKKAVEAQESAQKADSARQDAVTQARLAQEALEKVRQRDAQLEARNDELKDALTQTELAKQLAETNLNLAKEQQRLALLAQKQEESQRRVAEDATRQAIASRDSANALFMLTVAQSMEAKAVTMDDAQLSGLLAMQGYLYHTKYGGKKYDPYVFRGLYYAAAKINGYHYNAITAPGNLRNRLYSLSLSSKSDEFYVTGSDGRIFSASIHGGKVDNVIGNNNFPNNALDVSRDESYLAVGTDSSSLQVFNLKNPSKPLIITGHTTYVNDVEFLPDNSGFISAGGDKTLRFNNHKTGESRLLVTLPYEIKSISINKSGTKLAGGSLSGKVILVDLATNDVTLIKDEGDNRIPSVAFHPNQNKIAYGLEIIGNRGIVTRGLVKVVDFTNNRVKELGGHKSGVSAIEFSPDGLLMATASTDRILQMWVVDHEEDLPIIMDNNNGSIWSIGFSKNSDYLLASCENGEIRIWPTDAKLLADIVCPSLTRSMTKEEWDIYVGEKIAFEKTCEK